jgi:hypothetical protein
MGGGADELLIGPGKSLADEQSRMNSSTRGQWDWYANHRRQIERLIVPQSRGQRICVLGAGNCNDLDLRYLSSAYGEVHLVDIDPEALTRAAERQGVAGAAALRLHAPVDLTGITEVTRGWKGRSVSSAEVEAAIRAAGESQHGLAERFDVVLSPCVLSQLLCGVRDALGKEHPDWPRLKSAIRARHLRTVIDHCAAGGRGVFVIDLASTSAIPGLDRATEADLPGLMRRAVDDGKCFHGLRPAELRDALRNVNTTISLPWLWHLGWGKAFLCYAVTCACRA